ncbi:hypothetical protein CR513_23804, partial [Mucuna pruriens]
MKPSYPSSYMTWECRVGSTLRGSNKPIKASSEKDPELEQVSLTFKDPRLGTNRESDPSHAKPYGSAKRKPKGSPEHPRREDTNKRTSQERYIREIERKQALTEKQELKAALANSLKKEAEVNDQLSQL